MTCCCSTATPWSPMTGWTASARLPTAMHASPPSRRFPTTPPSAAIRAFARATICRPAWTPPPSTHCARAPTHAGGHVHHLAGVGARAQCVDGLDTAAIDALCARTNPGQVVDVPTGVGFCMYIRRDSLNAVGLFDTEHFGKGYGEENDFCQRAAAAGWRNLHLLDTFVLHTGGVSFGESKSPRERAAMETLRRLHPRYEADVMAFVQADPARTARLALDVARLQAQAAHQPVVLAVLHDRAGGTVRHVRELAQFLQGKALFLMLSPAAGGTVVLRRAEEKEAFELAFRINDQMEELVQALRQLDRKSTRLNS